MKAIVLAAGYGTRLKPLTKSLPKPLMPIVGRPLLWHIIMKLKKCLVTDIGINVHHNAKMIKKFLEQEDLGVHITVFHEENILGVAGGIGSFREFLNGEDFFIIHNGDVVTDIPLEKLTDIYQINKPLCAMVLQDHLQYNNVSIDEDNNIVDVRDILKPRNVCRKLAYTGLAFINTEFLKHIPDGPSDLIPILLDIIKEGKHKIQAIVTDGYAWWDIGTISSYLKVHEEILTKKKPLIDTMVLPPGPIFLGNGSRMEEGVKLRGFVSAGENCLLKKRCQIENCVIWDNTIVEEDAIIKNSIIGEGWFVDAS
jgi:NDP-sugar pyrophosphorylase family protein